MKKLTLTLFVASLLSLTACQKTDESQPQAQNQPETQSTPAVSTQSSWTADYLELLNSGQEIKHEKYPAVHKTLNDIRQKSGATYAYIIMPIENGKPSMTGNPNGDFMLTLDGTDDPDEWGEVYEHEVQFSEAWQGQTALARSAWDDEGGEKLWSGFAPIYQDNKVIALLGMDYPVNDVIAKHPEWNRDDKAWNGFTDKITGEVPKEIQEIQEKLSSLVKQYADELSH